MEMACIDTSQLPFAQHARAALAAIMPLSELSESVLTFAGQLTQPHTPVARAGVQTPQQPHTPQPPLKLPTLREIAAAPYTNLAPHIGHAAAARSVHSAFLQITVEAERARFLSRCGHGGAAFMVADRQPQLYPIPCDVYRLAVARALGISHPAIQITSCDKCELVFTTPLEAMDHLARCPKSPACHAVHKATVNVFNTISSMRLASLATGGTRCWTCGLTTQDRLTSSSRTSAVHSRTSRWTSLLLESCLQPEEETRAGDRTSSTTLELLCTEQNCSSSDRMPILPVLCILCIVSPHLMQRSSGGWELMLKPSSMRWLLPVLPTGASFITWLTTHLPSRPSCNSS